MNKSKFVELMKAPDKMSGSDFAELAKVVSANPFFQTGHIVLAKGSKVYRKDVSGRLINRAALYATDRNTFKGYITDNETSQSTPPVPTKTTASAPSPSFSTKPSLADKEQDALIKDTMSNLEQWKKNREDYLKFDQEHPENIIIEPVQEKVEEPVLDVSSMESLKNQIAEEVENEEIQATVQKVEEKIAEEPKVTAVDDLQDEKNELAEKLVESAEDAFTKEEEFNLPPKPEPLAEKPEEVVESENETPEANIEDISVADIESVSSPEPIIDQQPEPDAKPEPTPPTPTVEVSGSDPIIESIDDLDIDLSLDVTLESPAAADSVQKDNKTSEEPVAAVDAEETIAKAIESVPVPTPEDDLLSADQLSAIVDVAEKAFKEEDTKEKEEETASLTVDNVFKEDSTPSAVSQNELEEAEQAVDEFVSKQNEEEEELKQPEPVSEEEKPVAATVEEPAEVPVTDDSDTIPDEEIAQATSNEETTSEQPNTSENEEELDRIDSEKQKLKLELEKKDNKPKKFRLSVMKRPINFTKNKPQGAPSSSDKNSESPTENEASSPDKNGEGEKKKSE